VWPDDAARLIEILNESFRLSGTLKAILNDAKFLQRVGGGECAVRHFVDYQHLKTSVGLWCLKDRIAQQDDTAWLTDTRSSGLASQPRRRRKSISWALTSTWTGITPRFRRSRESRCRSAAVNCHAVTLVPRHTVTRYACGP
jgi:hypothetical protein